MLTLGSSRLTLRDIRDEDWSAVHSYSTLDEVVRYQPWGPNTVEQSQEFVSMAAEESRARPRTVYHLAVIEKVTDRFVGTVSMNIRTDDSRIEGEIGYFLHPDFWKRGYATEAAQLLLRYGFQELKLQQVTATCDPRNEASKRVLDKLGMVYARRDQNAMQTREGWRDSDVYVITRLAWDRLQA